MNTDKLMVFSLAISGLGVYGTFLPSIYEVSNGTQTPDEKAALREAEFIGTVHLIAIAALTAYVAQSSIPLLLAIGLGVSVFVSYEYAISRVVSKV